MYNKPACPKCQKVLIRKYRNQNKWTCYRCKHIFETPIDKTILILPFGKKRKRPKVLPSQEDLIKSIEQINNLRTKALICTLYLTGSRISEIVRSLRVEQIQPYIRKNKNFILIKNLKVLKKRNDTDNVRTIQINPRLEQFFLNILLEYVSLIKKPEAYLFDISRSRAENILKEVRIFYYETLTKENKLYPHLLRHMRAQHLLDNKKYDLLMLKTFFNWSSTKPAEVYAIKNFEHLMQREEELEINDKERAEPKT